MREVGLTFKHRITFMHLVEGQNEVGDDILVEEPFKTVWAKVGPLKGREYIEARKVQPELTYLFETRYIEGITPDMTIKFKGRAFNIQSILNVDERNRFLEIYAVEKVEK
jgi:SPP1 family predicted phage head-tail adaptor